MTKLLVDGKEIDVPPDYTLLQACEAAGAEIPRFCFHERLSIAGNCRMCLIEVAGMPKPQASCAMGVKDLPPNKDGSPKELSTRSPMVRKAREGVMEFLLINHPLDCPICDQGGECEQRQPHMLLSSSQECLHNAAKVRRAFKVGIVARALKHDEPSIWNQLLHDMSIRNWRVLVAIAPHEQRWRLNPRQELPEILINHPHE